MATPTPNVIAFTVYSVLVPLMLLEYAQEVEVEATHHRFMPWWAIVWLTLTLARTLTRHHRHSRPLGSAALLALRIVRWLLVWR